MADICVKSQAVLSADSRRYQAMNNADVDVLADILHDRFYYAYFSGRTEGKFSYLENIRSGKVKYGKARTSDISLSEYGVTVVMHGRMQLDCFAEDVRHFPLDNVFTSVWIDCGDAWRIVAWASTAANGV